MSTNTKKHTARAASSVRSTDTAALVERLIQEARENSKGELQLTRESLASALCLTLGWVLEGCDYDRNLESRPAFVGRVIASLIMRVEQMPAAAFAAPGVQS